MPDKKQGGQLPSPWREFLEELDDMLTEPLELHCIGGFVLVYFYALPRTTGGIDYYTAVPAKTDLEDLAGWDSHLRKKHGIWLQRVGVAVLPEDYEGRLSDMTPGFYKYLRLLVPDPYDCILSKLQRNTSKDRDDADYLFRSQKLNPQVLRDRYEKELRHNLIGNIKWHDDTLTLWIEIFTSGS